MEEFILFLSSRFCPFGTMSIADLFARVVAQQRNISSTVGGESKNTLSKRWI